MRKIKSDFEKTRDRNIRSIKKSIKNLKGLGYTIEIQPTETMIGTIVEHIYLRDKFKNGRIVEQKYLFTAE